MKDIILLLIVLFLMLIPLYIKNKEFYTKSIKFDRNRYVVRRTRDQINS